MRNFSYINFGIRHMAGARILNLTFIRVVISNESLNLLPEVVPTYNKVTKST